MCIFLFYFCMGRGLPPLVSQYLIHKQNHICKHIYRVTFLAWSQKKGIESLWPLQGRLEGPPENTKSKLQTRQCANAHFWQRAGGRGLKRFKYYWVFVLLTSVSASTGIFSFHKSSPTQLNAETSSSL